MRTYTMNKAEMLASEFCCNDLLIAYTMIQCKCSSEAAKDIVYRTMTKVDFILEANNFD